MAYKDISVISKATTLAEVPIPASVVTGDTIFFLPPITAYVTEGLYFPTGEGIPSGWKNSGLICHSNGLTSPTSFTDWINGYISTGSSFKYTQKTDENNPESIYVKQTTYSSQALGIMMSYENFGAVENHSSYFASCVNGSNITNSQYCQTDFPIYTVTLLAALKSHSPVEPISNVVSLSNCNRKGYARAFDDADYFAKFLFEASAWNKEDEDITGFTYDLIDPNWYHVATFAYFMYDPNFPPAVLALRSGSHIVSHRQHIAISTNTGNSYTDYEPVFSNQHSIIELQNGILIAESRVLTKKASEDGGLTWQSLL